jgi:anti-sigma-K factor RskA
MIPDDPEEREAMAGEYALGTLDARLAEEMDRAMARDSALRAQVASWEARLAPLTALAPPEAPPPALWERIEAALPGVPPLRDSEPVPLPTPPPRRRVTLWQGWAAGATAIAAGLAGLLLLRPAPEPRLMTVLLTSRDQPAWLVEADRAGALRLAALNPRPLEPGRAMELGALPPGATAPTSLGLIPPEGQLTVRPQAVRPEPGMLIEVSLEPPGGSPTGRPTGPVLFIGRLTAVGGS